MDDFPLTLPLPEGYSPQRDFYPAHDHDHTAGPWWWIWTGASAAAPASPPATPRTTSRVVGEAASRKAARCLDARRTLPGAASAPWSACMFRPMLCQHCDNAPCEAVCPVYAPHQTEEGLNSQIYNRCIGRATARNNCPYKVRRFNWFDSAVARAAPAAAQPRGDGPRKRGDGEVHVLRAAHQVGQDGQERNTADSRRRGHPACAQTCPTGAHDVRRPAWTRDSRVRRLCGDPRGYQVLEDLNTKPAVTYLKKVLHEVRSRKGPGTRCGVRRKDRERQRSEPDPGIRLTATGTIAAIYYAKIDRRS